MEANKQDELMNAVRPADADATNTMGMPAVVDRATWMAEVEELRVREKARMRAGDATGGSGGGRGPDVERPRACLVWVPLGDPPPAWRAVVSPQRQRLPHISSLRTPTPCRV